MGERELTEAAQKQHSPQRRKDRKDDQGAEELSEERLEEIKRRRFQERVMRVLEVMQRERVDWRGVPSITPDGRIGVRVVPVEVQL